MLVLHSQSDTLEIIYHRDYHLLIGRFLRALTEAENRQCYQELLAAAHAHDNARSWLLDIRRRGRSGPQVLGWLQRDFYDQLRRELGEPLRLVYFMAPGLRSELLTDSHVPAPDAYAPGSSFRIHQATTESEAVQWLLDEQAATAGG